MAQASSSQANRRLSRRRLLLEVGAPVVGGLLAASMAPASGALAAPARSTARVAPYAQAASRPLTPTFYQWIIDLHPSVPQVNDAFKATAPLNFQIAPVQGFGIDRFVAEARDRSSTWDVYVGMTPFIEMSSLIAADVIEPWDNYIPRDVLNDLIPTIRDECTVDGHLYSWPFLLDIVILGSNAGQSSQTGISTLPATWDEVVSDAQRVQSAGAAPYGVVFDAHGWRSLAPITHSISTSVYTPDLFFDFTSEPALQALDIMKQMRALSAPNVLSPGTTDAGVNDTPDENAFAAQQATYYVKYQNAPLRFAATWPDPNQLQLGPLPKPPGGEGATVFWTTGACLFKYGQNKDQAAEYMKALTYDPGIWRDSIGGTPTAHPGQLPPYQSVYAGWDTARPDWMQDWVPLVFSQLQVARAIPTQKFGLTQFSIGQPYWERYLTGEELDPRVAMQAASDAVQAQVKQSS
jgi:ABC-type glycerol-3-phosphate transport system substrate-binding protein